MYYNIYPKMLYVKYLLFIFFDNVILYLMETHWSKIGFIAWAKSCRQAWSDSGGSWILFLCCSSDHTWSKSWGHHLCSFVCSSDLSSFTNCLRWQVSCEVFISFSEQKNSLNFAFEAVFSSSKRFPHFFSFVSAFCGQLFGILAHQ